MSSYIDDTVQNWDEQCMRRLAHGHGPHRAARIAGGKDARAEQDLAAWRKFGGAPAVTPTRPQRVNDIVDRIAAKHRVSPWDLCYSRRRGAERLARFECWWTIRQEMRIDGSPPSYPKIAAWFGRDNATILNGVRRFTVLTCEAA
jgi:hypothetical protein